MADSSHRVDEGRVIIDLILRAPVCHERKMELLAAAEPSIVALYNKGLTSVKPCRYMSDDDLVH